jgi:DNA modification methylase
MEVNKIYNTDCLTGLKILPDNSIDCCVTSPPYFGLRDYGMMKQIGLEETPELYVEKMVEVFTEVKRVLKQEGTLWLNLGDSYASTGKNRTVEQACAKSGLNGGGDLKSKDLIGIPWMVAFALRSSGWYLRQDIIWAKPNPMPESVTDRCTKSHEYIFLMSKSRKYYYDAEAIKEEAILANWENRKLQDGSEHKTFPTEKINGIRTKSTFGSRGGEMNGLHSGKEWIYSGTRNKRSVWTATTRPFSEAHFATFPERLIIDCIKAGCPENGIVLDPFMGAGTTALVAKKLNRNYIGFELNPDYIKIAEKRLYNQIGMFL